MSPLPCVLDGASIVLTGSLNPAIFQPAWFAAQGLLRREEAETAKLELISSEVTSFSTSWLRLLVMHDKFSATCTGADGIEPLRDLVVGTFTLLEHTPLAMLGINRHMHYRAPDEDHWHRIGHLMAPKEPWTRIVKDPGLRSLTMKCRRPDDRGGDLFVKLEPSTAVPLGVFVDVNDHYGQPGATTVDVVATLRKEYIASLELAKHIGDTITEAP